MQPSPVIRFGVFELDSQAGELRKHGLKIKLQDQPFQILVMLLEQPGQVVTREQLHKKLWSDGTVIDFEHGLNAAIQRLRQALGDSAENPRFVETLARRGYRFLAPVDVARNEAPANDGNKQPGDPAVPAMRRNRQLLSWAVIATLLLAVVGLAAVYFRPRPSEVHTVRFQIPVPDKANYLTRLEVSSNGRHVLIAGAGLDDQDHLWVHSLDSMTTRLLPGSYDFLPFWSPDSRFVAFFEPKQSGGFYLKKMDLAGGPAQTICDTDSNWIGGGTWNRDGIILFAKSRGAQQHNSMFRVSAEGGEVRPVLPLDTSRRELNQTNPRFLPDGRHFLYQSFYGSAQATERVDQASTTLTSGIFLASLDSKESRILVATNSKADYVAPGFLIYGQGATLVAQPFDVNQFRITGEPFPVADHVQPIRDQTYLFSSASDHDVLAFGNEASGINQLIWCKRDGARLGSIGEPVKAIIFAIALSPDEKRLAVNRVSPETNMGDVWTGELSTGIFTRLTSGSEQDLSPVWSPDGHELAFSSDRGRFLAGGGINLYRKPAGGGEQELLFASERECKFPRQWLPDGSILFEIWADTPGAFYLLPLSGNRKPVLLLKNEFVTNLPKVSSDGRWVAYYSEESGQSEIYVAAFPTFKEKRQVSNGGGCQPQWRKDGKELFYLTLDGKMMSIDVRRGTKLETGTPTVLFQAPFRVTARGRREYCVTGDGQRFIFGEPVEARKSLNVVLNAIAGLNHR